MCCGILCKFIAFIIAGVGIAAIIIGAVVGFAVLPDNIRDEVERRVRLEYGTDQFERWQVLPFNQTAKIYFFEPSSETNFRTVNQRGPFVYKMNRRKTVDNRNADDDTITYQEHLTFDFDATESAFPDTEQLNLLNVPLVSLVQSIENRLPEGINDEINSAFENPENLFRRFSVRDFLFQGYTFCANPTAAPNLCPSRDDINNMDYIEAQGATALSFAFLRHRHNAFDGTYVITAGMDDIRDLGLIRTWNGQPNLPNNIWGNTGQCREINGRDSTIFPPNIHRNDNFRIFYSDICRTVTLEHVENVDFEGISTQRREFEETTLNNDNDNTCYCTRGTNLPDGSEQCWQNGFTDLFTCTGSHVVLSYPHFLDVRNLPNPVQGLTANWDDHGSYTLIEAGTGTPLKIVKRFQYNMVIRNIDRVNVMTGLEPTIYPVLWIEETMELPWDLIDKIHDTYLAELNTVTIITWVLIGGGIAIFIASILLKLLCCC
ncbi:sensory neuron membrane protein 2-like [Onthophagus taurus]|uniref:sensory neuron membrane protein 2-like n=1 Tax=Onthophagus taurus TaxID=166361 RepID=UPI0039BDB8D9